MWNSNNEYNGISKLRFAVILALVSFILIVAALSAGYSILIALAASGGAPGALAGIGLGTLIAVGVVSLASFIIYIIGIFNLRGGFNDLVSAGVSEMGIGSKGALLQIITIIIAIILAILVPVIGFFLLGSYSHGPVTPGYAPGVMQPTGILPAISIILTIVEIILGIVSFVGGILIGIGFYRVGSRYDDGLTKVGGILYIIPFLNIIGVILLILGLGTIRNKLQGGFRPSSGQYIPPGQPYGQQYPNYGSNTYPSYGQPQYGGQSQYSQSPYSQPPQQFPPSQPSSNPQYGQGGYVQPTYTPQNQPYSPQPQYNPQPPQTPPTTQLPSENKKICPVCGYQNEPIANFCTRCGQKL
ncbi:hypothetical protein HS7_12930 [Sulfolobales archaeon HS-7]|nr:hypothetical protein HS7_12930 [Sulfolobales archaeon HS-7]